MDLGSIRLDRAAQQPRLARAVAVGLAAVEGLEQLQAVGVRVEQRRDAIAEAHLDESGTSSSRAKSR